MALLHARASGQNEPDDLELLTQHLGKAGAGTQQAGYRRRHPLMS